MRRESAQYDSFEQGDLAAVRDHLAAATCRTCRTASATPPRHGAPCPGSTQVACTASNLVSDANAPSGSSVKGAGRGPRSPVRTFLVVMASPTNNASTAGRCTATLPGVCPGTWMIRGDPGRSSVSPSVKVATSWTGGMRNPPCRALYQRKPNSGPTLMGPQPSWAC
jgi:hypothetical protein